MKELITAFNRRLACLSTERSSFISVWMDLNDYLLPQLARFYLTDRNKGDRKPSKIIDSTASFAIKTLSAGMMAGITNPARPWFNLRVQDTQLNEWGPVNKWLYDVKKIMSDVFITSNLYNVLPLTYKELGVFGTGSFEVLEDNEKVMRCYPMPLGSYYLGAGDKGVVDTCYREYSMTAGQLVQRFGLENVSASVKRAYENHQLDQWFDVIYVVEPNDKADKTLFDSKYKKWRAVFYEKAAPEGKFLQEKGFDEFPVLAPRWEVTGEDVYGHGPGYDALGDVMALQQEQKRKLQIIDKGTSPALSAPTTLQFQRVSQLPGAITFVDTSQGQGGVQPLYEPNPAWLQYLSLDIQEVQQRLKRVFFEDLFLLISQDERSNITAHEIVARNEEKMLILGPVLTRLNDELLDPLIDRSFNILDRARKLPPAPREIQGQPLTVEYISTMAQAMKLSGVTALERLTQFTSVVGQTFPTVIDLFNADEAITEMASMLGTPPKLLNDKDHVDAVRAQRAREAQIAKTAELANSAAATTKSLADAEMTEPSALSGIMAGFQGQGMGGQYPALPSLPGINTGNEGMEGAA